VRTLTAAIITVGLVASLSACATGAPSGDCTPTTKSGDASELITAAGDPGTVLKPAFPTPLITKGLEVSTISEGDGKTVYPGEIADFHLTVVDAKTAEVVPITGVDADSILRRTAGETSDKFGTILNCAAVGDRLGVTISAKSIGFSGGGLDENDTVVLIIDVVRSFIGRADGVPQLAQNGMPAIALAPSGQPGVTIPNADAPTKTQTATTILGSGETVKESNGEGVVIHQTVLSWDSKAVLTSTWEWDGAPAVPTTVLAKEDRTGSGAGVIPAVAKALIGAKVGSQLLVVVPPGDDSFSDDATLPAGATADDTLVYVIDILGIQKD
jgi:hypothetical protein